MNENRISISLSPADITAISQAIDTLAQKLQPILIALDAEDKRMLGKLGEKSISYVDKIVQYAKAIYDDLSRRYEAQKARRLKPEPLK